MIKTITNYFNKIGVSVNGWLTYDLQNNNIKALIYPYYSIKNLLYVRGIEDLLRQLASIKNLNNDGERRYRNLLTEFFGIYFVRKILRFKVIEVESKVNKVISPYSVPGKYCDIKALKRTYKYFEVKDLSSQITTRYSENNSTYFTPADDLKIERWIKTQTKKADICGANFLICRVPVWLPNANITNDFFEFWPERIFRNLFAMKKRLSSNSIRLFPNFSVSTHLKGIYIVKEFGHLKLKL